LIKLRNLDKAALLRKAAIPSAIIAVSIIAYFLGAKA
jgi:hypothetical protein